MDRFNLKKGILLILIAWGVGALCLDDLAYAKTREEIENRMREIQKSNEEKIKNELSGSKRKSIRPGESQLIDIGSDEFFLGAGDGIRRGGHERREKKIVGQKHFCPTIFNALLFCHFRYSAAPSDTIPFPNSALYFAGNPASRPHQLNTFFVQVFCLSPALLRSDELSFLILFLRLATPVHAHADRDNVAAKKDGH